MTNSICVPNFVAGCWTQFSVCDMFFSFFSRLIANDDYDDDDDDALNKLKHVWMRVVRAQVAAHLKIFDVSCHAHKMLFYKVNIWSLCNTCVHGVFTTFSDAVRFISWVACVDSNLTLRILIRQYSTCASAHHLWLEWALLSEMEKCHKKFRTL